MCISSLISLLIISHVASGAKILFVLTTYDASDQRLFTEIYHSLSLTGHEVHVLTYHPIESITDLLHQYDLSDLNKGKDEFGDVASTKLQYSKENDFFTMLFDYNDSIHNLLKQTEDILSHKESQKLFRENENFDVCVLEWRYPLMSLLGAYFNCSVIGFSSERPGVPALDALLNYSYPMLSPHYNYLQSTLNELGFTGRLKLAFWVLYVRFYHYLIVIPNENALFRKYVNVDLQCAKEIEQLISVLLLIKTPSLQVPSLPTIVDLSAVEDYEPFKAVDPKLLDFLNTSPSGVIYLNLGAGVRLKDVSPKLEETLMVVFMHMPYDWIWVYDGDELNKNYVNVYQAKSIPGNALYHPKVKLFIINGENQSLELAKRTKKPIIGVPFDKEQAANVDAFIESGAGFRLDPDDILHSSLAAHIIEIFHNSSYAYHAKALIDKDTTEISRRKTENAIWWIEYVIRTDGAKHLRSEAIDFSWRKLLMSDIFAALLFIVLITVLIVLTCIGLLLKVLSKTINYVPRSKVSSNREKQPVKKTKLQKKKKKD